MATVLVSGANRGLGLEFAAQYLADGWNVIATCRNPQEAEQLNRLGLNDTGLEIFGMDVADFRSIDAIAEKLRGRAIDVLINNAGIFGPKPKAENDLRQTFGHMDYDIWADILRVNTMAPLKMAEAFYENVRASEQKKIVTITSLVGSIAGGGPALYAYPTSKAAVNKVMTTLARELEPDGVIVTLFNPGWVKTDMGGSAADIDADQSIRCLRKLIFELTLEHSGSFLDYDGRAIPW